ncbi:DUF397 domain-containing protein [Actinocorallia longicatena]|uniref:DUF397 domain-containing protein n=1 Tax=Actinocorallia longicatena TaxID=111803 RepID=A0ABP6QBS2_9ACTN
MDGLTWRKASHSSQHGDDCVELAALPGAVAVRDSKHPDGARLALSRRALGGLARGVRAGRQGAQSV